MGEQQQEDRMEMLRKKMRDKVLLKQIRGQQIIMGRKASSSSRETFTYGKFEEVYPMTFNFILCIGGYSGEPEHKPREGFEWIRLLGDTLRYEVLTKDLEGNYREKDETA